MYLDRPIRDAKRTFPPIEEQVRVLKEAAQRYAEIYRTHNVRAMAFQTTPAVGTRMCSGGRVPRDSGRCNANSFGRTERAARRIDDDQGKTDRGRKSGRAKRLHGT